MGDDVPVGVPHEPSRVVDRDTAEHERYAVTERVSIDSETDTEVAHTPSLGSGVRRFAAGATSHAPGGRLTARTLAPRGGSRACRSRGSRPATAAGAPTAPAGDG